MPLPILVVFDIDETLLQFINKKPYHFWEDVPAERKAAFTCDDNEVKRQCIIYRPHLKEFFNFVKKNPYVHVALWTYSEQEYAENIAHSIVKTFGLAKDPFVFKYGTEQIVNHSIPKDLNDIWNDPQFGGKYNKFNTFLVDDRVSNLTHRKNQFNSVLVKGFEPLGASKSRGEMTDTLFRHAVEDDVFVHLMKVIKNVHKDISGCSEEEIEDALSTEHIFPNQKTCTRKGLKKYMKSHYAEDIDDDVLLVTIGNIDASEQHLKGGRRNRSRKLRSQNAKRRSQNAKTARRSRTASRRTASRRTASRRSGRSRRHRR